jgi:hypothetical protein
VRAAVLDGGVSLEDDVEDVPCVFGSQDRRLVAPEAGDDVSDAGLDCTEAVIRRRW